jgi:hypothetical protein
MTTTIEKVLGVKPTNNEVDAEFAKRNLCLDEFKETIVESADLFHVHGNFSTRSDNAETASKKMLIIYNELNC